MKQVDLALQRLSLLTAWSISLLIAMGAPAAYYLVSYHNLRSTLELQALLAIKSIDAIIVANPKMWYFEEARLSELLEHRAYDAALERKRILDASGAVIASNNVTIPPPGVSYTRELFDAGTAIARIEMSRSLRPLLYMTFLVAICSSMFAALLFFVFRLLPIRVIHRAFQALERSEKKYRSLYETMKEGMALHRMDCDDRGNLHSLTVIDVNPSCAAMFGHDPGRIVGGNSITLFGDGFSTVLSHQQQLEQGDSISFELQLPDTDNHYIVRAFSPDQGVIATLFEDVTERRKSEQQIRHMAYFDPLTDLPNRTLFFDRLNQAIAAANREQARLAVLFLDLDHFKSINDTLGHDIGDQVLIEVSRRLQRHIRSCDTLARMGGDEFVLVITGIGETLDASCVARKLIDSIHSPLSIRGNELHISMSMGIALFADNGADAETLIKNADLAMYHAKESGRNAYRFYSPTMGAPSAHGG